MFFNFRAASDFVKNIHIKVYISFEIGQFK